MKTSLIDTHDHSGRYRGHGVFRDRLTEQEVEWLRNNLPTPGAWFYGWDNGVVNRVLYFNHPEDRALFLVACGSQRR
jgi:hypothetical protein